MLLLAVACVADIISFLQLVQKLVYLICGCLSVIIKADHDIPLRCAHTCHQCRMLPEVFRKIYSRNERILFAK